MPVHTKPIISALLAVVVKVGAEPPAHLIVLNHVTVRDPVPSCKSLSIKHWPVDGFDSASVLLPPSVTVWMLEAAKSKVIVAPSLSAVIACSDPLIVGLVRVAVVSAAPVIVGLVRVLFVIVCVPVGVTTFVVLIAPVAGVSTSDRLS